MDEIRESDVKALLGEIDALVIWEIVRTEARISELHRAFDIVTDPCADDDDVSRALPTRMRRLIDLLLAALDHPNVPATTAETQGKWRRNSHAA